MKYKKKLFPTEKDTYLGQFDVKSGVTKFLKRHG